MVAALITTDLVMCYLSQQSFTAYIIMISMILALLVLCTVQTILGEARDLIIMDPSCYKVILKIHGEPVQ